MLTVGWGLISSYRWDQLIHPRFFFLSLFLVFLHKDITPEFPQARTTAQTYELFGTSGARHPLPPLPFSTSDIFTANKTLPICPACLRLLWQKKKNVTNKNIFESSKFYCKEFKCYTLPTIYRENVNYTT